MKKIINAVLILALILNLVTFCASAEDLFTFSVTADKTEIAPGETVNLSIATSANANIYSGTFVVNYDSLFLMHPKLQKIVMSLKC